MKDMMDATQPNKIPKLEFSEILSEYQDSVDADRENREEALDDMQFAVGEHWPDEVKRKREKANRPCMTVNRMPQFIRQVTGDIRRTNPAISVIPGDDEASEDMADMLGGLIRSIEYKSDATTVYEGAAESAAKCGMGAFRVHYRKAKGGNEAYIESIPNPFSVHWDPLAKDPTRKDARYCFVEDKISRKEFAKKYPKAKLYDFKKDAIPSQVQTWYAQDTVVIAEYWCKKDGAVYWAKMNGQEILESGIFPGEEIPIIACMGEETHVGDRMVRTGVIRYAKDSQRMYNYFNSAYAEWLALQPKAPFIGTARQFAGNENDWNNANTDNLPYLVYNPDPQAPGAPQRAAPPLASAGLVQGIALASDDMKATTGIYDAALGDQSNETSGVAIRQRQLESDISTSIYVDNLSKSIAQCGRVLLGIIKVIYDTTRKVQIVDAAGMSSLVELNTPMRTPFGDIYLNNPGAGEFDVRIKTGPSYTTMRQEAVENMLEFVRAFPAAAGIAGDLVARNMDWPGADELADRLAKLANAQVPGIVESDEEPTPEEQQAMMQQQAMQQQQQAMAEAAAVAEITKAAAEATEAEADAQKAQVEASKAALELAMQNGEVNAVIEQAVEATVARILQSMMMQAPPTT